MTATQDSPGMLEQPSHPQTHGQCLYNLCNLSLNLPHDVLSKQKNCKLCVIFSFYWPSPWSGNPGCSCATWWTPTPPPHHHPSLGLAQSPGPDPNSLKLKQTNTNNQMNKWTVLTLMLPIQYTTVQYSTVTGEEDGVTLHSTLCGVRGLDLLSVTNVKNVTEEEERR